MFSCEFREIFENNFTEHLWATASDNFTNFVEKSFFMLNHFL